MLRFLTIFAISLMSTPALAHTGGHVGTGFLSGMAHPILGLDHLLAMVAVGIWAATNGGRSVWLVPATFVGVMALSAILGATGLQIPFVEFGIALSVVILGMLVATGTRMVLGLGMAVVALFAVFHGYAHGAELPAGASIATYMAGFTLSTAALHGFGVGLVMLLTRVAQGRSIRFVGAATAVAGAAIVAG